MSRARRHCTSGLIDAPGGFRIHVEEHLRPDRSDAPALLLVNGALASTRSFGWARLLLEETAIILYDPPHTGGSKAHNHAAGAVSIEMEVAILQSLLDRYRPAYLGSMSWGGMAAMLCLARQPPFVEKAVICSFSNRVNAGMRALLAEFARLLMAADHAAAAVLFNDTFGAHLPAAVKRSNTQYLAELGVEERHYMLQHIAAMHTLDIGHFERELTSIVAETLFINGALDELAAPGDAAAMARRMRYARTVTMPDTGHFLAAEGRRKAAQLAEIVGPFLEGQRRPSPVLSRLKGSRDATAGTGRAPARGE